jgi:L-fuculose-phosphate aldolase
MGKNLTKFLPKSRALILRNHGTLTWGESLEEAYFGTERLEHSARLLKYATEIAGGEPLPELPLAEIEELEKLRALLGDKIL